MATFADSAVREGQTAVSRRGDERVRDVGRPAAGAGAERGEQPRDGERGPQAERVLQRGERHGSPPGRRSRRACPEHDEAVPERLRAITCRGRDRLAGGCGAWRSGRSDARGDNRILNPLRMVRNAQFVYLSILTSKFVHTGLGRLYANPPPASNALGFCGIELGCWTASAGSRPALAVSRCSGARYGNAAGTRASGTAHRVLW